MTGESAKRTRLESWKEVARFFRRTERTVMRWEATRGLPIHRLRGQSGGRIYAEVSELEDWLKGGGPGDDHGDEAQRRRFHWKAPAWLTPALAAALAFVLIAGALLATGVVNLPRREADVPAEARGLYMKGMKDWEQRTPESLLLAIDEFNAAIRIAPDYAEAYAGLANCYNLASEYTSMPASKAFPLARDNAVRALKLDDRLGSAHAALAFSRFYGFWDIGGARREYDRALQLDPDNPTIRHWYATFLYTQRLFPQAVAQIELAQKLDPGSRSIRADRAILMWHAGRKDEAVKILNDMTAADPDFRSPHSYLAVIHFLDGDDEGFVREARLTAKLANDLYGEKLADAAETGLKAGGRKGMLDTMLSSEESQYRYGVGTAFNIAAIAAQAGDKARAIAYLKLAFDRRDDDLIYIHIDDRLAPLYGMPEYEDIVRKVQIKPAK